MSRDMARPRRILGIDPGSRMAGFGFIDVYGDRLKAVEYGVLRLGEKSPLPERLFRLGEALKHLMKEFRPHDVAIEQVFFGANADSAFKLGQARGVCLYEAARHELSIYEYAAREVKKGITGSGAAEKHQVKLLVLAQLNMSDRGEPEDATDALALAVHHANVRALQKRLELGLR